MHWPTSKDGSHNTRQTSVLRSNKNRYDYSKWVKRGFGRATDHASIDVRNGIMTREEGFELAKKIDAERPGELDYYLQITGYSENEFLDILEDQRQGQAKELPRVPRPSERSESGEVRK